MSASDDELVDRMAKKHSVSPAAVQVVLAALRSGGGPDGPVRRVGWSQLDTPDPYQSVMEHLFISRGRPQESLLILK
jgi:hypothetical protein